MDTNTWSVVQPSADSEIPSGRLFHAAAVIDDGMYVFGGTVDNNVRSSELFRFQFSCYPKCTLQDDFGRLLEKKQTKEETNFYDVEFIVSDLEGHNVATIPAHIAFCAARSQYLRNKIRAAQDLRLDSGLMKGLSHTNSFDDKPRLQISLKNVNPEAFELVLNYIYTDRIDPNKKSGDPLSNKIVLLMMDVYTLAVRFQMKRLEHLCVLYLNAAINHSNVLVAIQNATQLKLDFIKVFSLLF